MNERTIQIESIDPRELLGVNNKKFQFIGKHFPKLKLIARGDVIKAIGDEEELDRFESKLELFLKHFQKYNRLTESNIERLLNEDSHDILADNGGDDVLVHGNSGLQVKARTANQRKMVELSAKNDMVFAIGPAGTGKTYTAVALAVRALKQKEIRKIILTRPAVEAGENLGFLPGDLKDKLDPYLQPLYDALRDMIPPERLRDFLEAGIIQIAPLAYMRGRTLDKAFVILDEAQNATTSQLKMFLTRMGQSARFMITGDLSQIDLPKRQSSGLVHTLRYLKDIPEIGVVYLNENDVLRHPLVKKIIRAFDVNEEKEK
ncbi:PhoH family protein [Cryomorpha ignava]|uniref:PhoH-like protein n=1 Tax=Cryomorpha ignava TaxID=101383 RepID=A0A7K3WVD0_9FLAO|nr:PhoH family protein [Cryomorpha ignava]NEN25001.1 PhoH family protein [Cryomorpha ignava]